jgi:predicted metal-binding membrane protein
MVDRKLAGGVHHVGNHDGSYDAAFSCLDVSVLCGAERSRNEGTRTLLFVLAYLALWIAFSVAATAAQWALQLIGLISPMIVSRSSVLSGGLLLIAGLF